MNIGKILIKELLHIILVTVLKIYLETENYVGQI